MKTIAHFFRTLTLRQATSLLLAVCILHLNVTSATAMSGADPQTGNVSVGPIAAEGVTTVTVNAGADAAKAIINWQDLNISEKQTLQFIRDGGAFVVLNRDMQSSATQINGTILGNQGHIILINQNGIIFGPTASVQAAKFTAGAMTVSDQDFLTQDALKFVVTDGAVKNLGSITAEQVALIGREVINRGTIQTPAGGFVLLASADEVYLAESQTSPVRVRLSSDADAPAAVVNDTEGTIKAPEGTIVLAAGDLYVQALDGLGGLGASVETGSGQVAQLGTLSADSETGDAGNIALTAGRQVVLGQESRTTANAAGTGSGGDIIVYSPQAAFFREGARVEAKGGSEAGSGGFFELSGKEYLDMKGDIDLTAENGESGTFLIDPKNIKIVADEPEEGTFHDSTDIWEPWDGSGNDLQYSSLPISRLEHYLSYSSVILETDDNNPHSAQSGWVWFDAGRSLRNGESTSLTVNADNWIKMDSGIQFNRNNHITLNAKTDIIVNAPLTTHGSINLNADKDIQVNATLIAGLRMNLTADADHNVAGDLKTASGAALISGGTIDLRGNDIDLMDDVLAGGSLFITGRDCTAPAPVWGNIHAHGVLAAGGNIEISATGEEKVSQWVPTGPGSGYYRTTTQYIPGTITLDGDVVAGGSILLYNDTYTTNVSGNGVTFQAGRDILLKNDNAGPTAMDNCTFLRGDEYLALIAGGQIHAENTLIEVSGSTLKLQHTPDLDLKNFIFANQNNTDLIANSTGGAVIAVDAANGGKDENAADQWQSIESTALSDITLQGTDTIRTRSLHSYQGNIQAVSDSDDLLGSGPITADKGNITLRAADDIVLSSDVTAGGNIRMDASDDTISLAGNTRAGGYIHLTANTKLNGFGEQLLEAGRYIRADGFLRKCTAGDLRLLGGGFDELYRSIDLRYSGQGPAVSTHQGNLWMLGRYNIQVSGDITTFGPDCTGALPSFGCSLYGPWPTGGVLMLSTEGRLYTEYADGLNVNITGSSDHYADLGVQLPLVNVDSPFEQMNRLAIALVSADDLILGPAGSLNAFGRYYDDVDDRQSLFLLDEPAEIGGYGRNPGDAFDAAIYAASTTGNVFVNMSTQILSCSDIPQPASIPPAVPAANGISFPQTPKGAMVIDAYDTVTFGTIFKMSLAGNGITSRVGDRLEVVSRISEWLSSAYGRLPYADPAEGEGPFPAGYAYVLRGAGLENADITDGRAWVLEGPSAAAAAGEVPPLYRPEEPRLSGCPAEMDAAAAELGISSDQIHVAVANSLALNPTLNPCQACAQLITAATILRDMDGSRTAALAAVFEQLAPSDMPFTPEMGAAIAAAISQNAQADSRYASALEYVEAFVQYVTVVDRQLRAPIDDPVTFAMNRYGTRLAEAGNENIVAFLLMQVQQ